MHNCSWHDNFAGIGTHCGQTSTKWVFLGVFDGAEDRNPLNSSRIGQKTYPKTCMATAAQVFSCLVKWTSGRSDSLSLPIHFYSQLTCTKG